MRLNGTQSFVSFLRTPVLLFALSFSVMGASAYAAGSLLDGFNKLNIPKPSMDFKKVGIQGINLDAIKLRLETAVNNPYPIGLPKAGMDLNLNIEGTTLAKVASGAVAMAASKSTSVPFDLSLKFQDVVNIYKKVTGKEALDLGVAGAVKIPLPVKQLKSKGLYFKGMPTELKFPFKAEKLLPSVLPAIALKDFKILQPSGDAIKAAAGDALVGVATSFLTSLLSGKDPGSAAKAGLGSVDLPIQTEFKLALTNSAAAKVAFESLQYTLNLGGEKFLSGKSTHVENKGKESFVTVKTSFPLKSVSAGIAKAVSARKASFKLVGNSGMKIPSLGGDGDVPFDFDTKGDLKW